MNENTRRWIGNLTLVALSVLFTFGMLELVAPWLVRHLPLKLHFTLDRYQRVLAQSSKLGAVPVPPYVVLLGDSYAMGLGDWLLDADGDANPPYQAAHVLHELLGRDVVSFGRSGDSSMGAYVKRPFETLHYLGTTRYALPKPEIYVAYFYEGNDLEDNLRDLRGSYDGKYDESRFYDADYFRHFLELEWMEVERPWRWTPSLNDRSLVLRIVRKTLSHALFGWPEGYVPHAIHPGEVNRARMREGVVALPEPLQSASVGLAPPDLEKGLWTFEQSLRLLHDQQPDVPILLVFIPAPVTVYPISSPRVSTLTGREGDDTVLLRTREEVAARSDLVCGRLARVAEQLDIGFLDTRHSLWPVARERFIHGPKDWAHFNRAGYTALAHALAPPLETLPPPRGRCADVSAYFASIPPSS